MGMVLLDDNALMEQVKQNDKTAYEELVSRHYHAGLAFACQIVNDYHIAEDIVQEGFAKIYFYRDRYKPTFTFKTYLFTVIRNLAVDYTRKQKYSERLPAGGLSQTGAQAGTEQAVIEDETKRHLYIQIDNLKYEYKQVIYLYAIEDLSYKEIARVTGQTISQVKIRLHRARQILKKEIKEDEIHER